MSFSFSKLATYISLPLAITIGNIEQITAESSAHIARTIDYTTIPDSIESNNDITSKDLSNNLTIRTNGHDYYLEFTQRADGIGFYSATQQNAQFFTDDKALRTYLQKTQPQARNKLSNLSLHQTTTFTIPATFLSPIGKQGFNISKNSTKKVITPLSSPQIDTHENKYTVYKTKPGRVTSLNTNNISIIDLIQQDPSETIHVIQIGADRCTPCEIYEDTFTDIAKNNQQSKLYKIHMTVPGKHKLMSEEFKKFIKTFNISPESIKQLPTYIFIKKNQIIHRFGGIDKAKEKTLDILHGTVVNNQETSREELPVTKKEHIEPIIQTPQEQQTIEKKREPITTPIKEQMNTIQTISRQEKKDTTYNIVQQEGVHKHEMDVLAKTEKEKNDTHIIAPHIQQIEQYKSLHVRAYQIKEIKKYIKETQAALKRKKTVFIHGEFREQVTHYSQLFTSDVRELDKTIQRVQQGIAYNKKYIIASAFDQYVIRLEGRNPPSLEELKNNIDNTQNYIEHTNNQLEQIGPMIEKAYTERSQAKEYARGERRTNPRAENTNSVKLEQVSTTISTIKQENSILETAIDKEKKTSQELRTIIDDITQQLVQKNTIIKQLRAQIDVQDTKLSSVLAKLANEGRKIEKNTIIIEQLKTQESELRENISLLQKDKETLTQEKEKLDISLQEALTENTEVEEELSLAFNIDKEKDAIISKRENEQLQQQQEFTEVVVDAYEAEQSKEQLEKENKILEAENRQHKLSRKYFEQKLAQEKEQIYILKEQLTDQERTSENLQKRLDILETDHKKGKISKKELHQQAALLRTKLSQEQKAINTLQGKIITKNNQIDTYEEKIHTYEQQLAMKEQTIDKKEQEIQNKDIQNKKLLSENQKLKEKIKRYEEEGKTKRENTGTRTNTSIPNPEIVVKNEWTYTIKKGDTLYKLARRYYSNFPERKIVEAIRAINGSGSLVIGKNLRMPGQYNKGGKPAIKYIPRKKTSTSSSPKKRNSAGPIISKTSYKSKSGNKDIKVQKTGDFGYVRSKSSQYRNHCSKNVYETILYNVQKAIPVRVSNIGKKSYKQYGYIPNENNIAVYTGDAINIISGIKKKNITATKINVYDTVKKYSTTREKYQALENAIINACKETYQGNNTINRESGDIIDDSDLLFDILIDRPRLDGVSKGHRIIVQGGTRTVIDQSYTKSARGNISISGYIENIVKQKNDRMYIKGKNSKKQDFYVISQAYNRKSTTTSKKSVTRKTKAPY